jgi:hypothetical protein
LSGATACLAAGSTKDTALFQRLSYLYDAITLGILAGHNIHLPNIYSHPVQGAIACMGGNTLHIFGTGFSVTYQEVSGADYMEDRLLIAWTGERALHEWLEAIEKAHYPADFLTGNPPMTSPPSAWNAFTIHDEESQGVLEREMLARSAAAWGYRTQCAPDENDDIPRTYYFKNSADAIYARLLV